MGLPGQFSVTFNTKTVSAIFCNENNGDSRQLFPVPFEVSAGGICKENINLFLPQNPCFRQNRRARDVTPRATLASITCVFSYLREPRPINRPAGARIAVIE